MMRMSQARPFVSLAARSSQQATPVANLKTAATVNVSRGAVHGGAPAWGRAVLIGSMTTLFMSAIELPPALPLPSYELSVRGDATLPDGLPAAASTSVHVSYGSALQVVLRPAHDVKVPVEVRAYLVQGARRLRWPVHFEQAPSGTLRLRQRPQDRPQIFPGDWELLFQIESEKSSTIERLRTFLFADSHDLQELHTQLHVHAEQDSDSP